MTDDKELLEAWRAGDGRAGEQLFDRYARRLARFFYNKVHEGVDDLIQQTFLACVESQSTFRGDAKFFTFLVGVGRNVLRSHFRARSKDPAIDFSVTSLRDLGTSPSAAVARLKDHRVLLEGLRKLPLDSQIALELHYWEDMTAAEIGEVLELPVGTIKTRIRRAKELLGRELERLRRSGLATHASGANLDDWARSLKQKMV